jgi:hypothetical protein
MGVAERPRDRAYVARSAVGVTHPHRIPYIFLYTRPVWLGSDSELRNEFFSRRSRVRPQAKRNRFLNAFVQIYDFLKAAQHRRSGNVRALGDRHGRPGEGGCDSIRTRPFPHSGKRIRPNGRIDSL